MRGGRVGPRGEGGQVKAGSSVLVGVPSEHTAAVDGSATSRIRKKTRAIVLMRPGPSGTTGRSLLIRGAGLASRAQLLVAAVGSMYKRLTAITAHLQCVPANSWVEMIQGVRCCPEWYTAQASIATRGGRE